MQQTTPLTPPTPIDLAHLDSPPVGASPEMEQAFKKLAPWVRHDPFMDVLVELFPNWASPGNLEEAREGEENTTVHQRVLLRSPPDARRVLLAAARPYALAPQDLINRYYAAVRADDLTAAFMLALTFESLVDKRELMLRKLLRDVHANEPEDLEVPEQTKDWT